MWCPKRVSRLYNVGIPVSLRFFLPCVEAHQLHTNGVEYPKSDRFSVLCKELITPLLNSKKKQGKGSVGKGPGQTANGNSDTLFEQLTKAGQTSRDPALIKNISRLRHLWEYLHKDFGFQDQRGFLFSVAKCRRFVGYSAEETVRPALQFLIELGVSHTDLERMVIRFPKTLTFSVKTNMVPKVEYYRSLGLTDANIVSMVKMLPQLLCYKLETNIRPGIEYLKGLGLHEEDVLKVIVKYPALLGLSLTQNMEPTLGFFLSQGASKEKVALLVKRIPSVIGLSLEYNIRPKFCFASEVLEKSVEEIFSCPTYFSLSLQDRILFRVAVLDFLGVDFRKPAIRTLFLTASWEFKQDYGKEEVELFETWWGTLDKEQKAECVRNRRYMSPLASEK
ncbi:hypothetical protein BSKO_09064 [Bryopsis sp. KO-2023]|nr:hypothetical protein BSKO_09064 [Bryopsis sp. KO-2023]